ncbi:GGDEF domain-containing protein [Marinobacterium arenosum]|uniref:GGDEF domain-containing protein n=1 Tax=Marinobacterium arenosum TaxID=2862496 RepID=UPI002106DCD5|nr:GGDEF domain-containing protein [Marinobacterium arenosum]
MSAVSNVPSLEARLLEIIKTEQLEPHFQPIVDLNKGEVIGHEALIRGPANCPLQFPDALFNTAIECGRMLELELLCRKRSIERFAQLQLPGKLFLNVSASSLEKSEHKNGYTVELLRQHDIRIDRCVIELSEQHPFDHQGLTRAAVEHYRQMGFDIAIDDLGSGYSGLKLWSQLTPEYVKIDQHFIANIDRDPVKRELVRSVCNIGQSMRCKVIAEGIERVEELRTLKKLGVSLGQGYLLGRPEPLPQAVLPEAVLNEFRRAGNKRHNEVGETAFLLLRPAPAVSMDDRIGHANELFRQHPELTAIPVLSDGRPVGVVRKDDLLEVFSAQYGRALYENKPVSKLLSQQALVVESEMTLEQVSRMVTEQDDFTLQQDIVITQDGSYLGMGSVRDLLKRITELKIRNARYSNPLTLLPGNVPIQREIDLLLQQTSDFRVAYFDLNNFKPFNDCYGYSKGDQVIRLLGDLLVRYADSSDNFVGHIGGDDFVVIFRHPQWQQICERILSQFDEQVRGFYNPRDLQQGGIWASDRKGEATFYPLLGLAIGVVHPDPYKCTSHHEVAELAALAKKEAKKGSASTLFVSRRRMVGYPSGGTENQRRDSEDCSCGSCVMPGELGAEWLPQYPSEQFN